ncbi:hypothetical protein [Ruminococcus albus]|uniref:Uncharacterized protein n=1 Tax=Ruminococcus albus TaxID=1264 RepID=A0A1H7KQT7_RUMAL|nr:hypothetical protein [Ruminococcus albus]SEK88307.1 hypothetical protein SAMN05216469_10735 [Ruminococcus albus]
MIHLPDFAILDFLEWLSSSIKSYEYSDNIDIYDLLFDEEYEMQLYHKAEDYCSNNNQRSDERIYDPDKGFEMLFRMFQESPYYQDCISRNKDLQLKGNDYKHIINSFFYYFRNFCFDPYYQKRTHESIFHLDMNADTLICNARDYLESGQTYKESKRPYLNFMTLFKNPVEIDFVDWLGQNDLKIDKMTVDQFEDLANAYCIDNHKSMIEAEKLIKFFKRSDNNTIINRLRWLFNGHGHKSHNLKYIIERYCNEENRFKCLILTLQNDENYKKMIRDHWSDFDFLSGEELDIYYSNDYAKSGYEFAAGLDSIKEKCRLYIPCIVLWKDEMSEAQYIGIDGLNVEMIHSVIQRIVNEIQEGNTLNDIAQKAVEEVNRMQDSNKPKEINNTINNYGNMGSAVIGDNAKVSVNFNSEEESSFLNELNEACKIISGNSDLTDEQKNVLLEIFNTARESVTEKSESKANDSKSRFKMVLTFMEDHGSKIIASLAGLATIVKFFKFDS